VRIRSGIGLAVTAAILEATAVPAQAALITFSSRGLFAAAAPGLPLETFESGLVAPGAVTLCSGPVSSAAASACFPLGGLLPGVTYSATPNGSMAVIGTGFPALGNSSKLFGPNAFVDTFNMTFASATAVGFDVFPGPTAGNVVISVFDLANLPLGSFTIAAPIMGGAFFGAVSDAGLIGRINIASQTSVPAELVDNVAFGVSQIPEPASAVLVGLSLAGLARRRRRPLS
jgi:PEP-CTERM motif